MTGTLGLRNATSQRLSTKLRQWGLFDKAKELDSPAHGRTRSPDTYYEERVGVYASNRARLLGGRPERFAETPGCNRRPGEVQHALHSQSQTSSGDRSPVRYASFADLPKGGMIHVHSWGTLSEEGAEKILLKTNPRGSPRSLQISEARRNPAKHYPDELAFLQKLKADMANSFTTSN